MYGYGNFAIRLDLEFFHKLHIQSVSENFKLWSQISNPNLKLPTQFAHEPKYLVVSILLHTAKVLVILLLVRQNWLKWPHEKYYTHKKRWVRVYSYDVDLGYSIVHVNKQESTNIACQKQHQTLSYDNIGLSHYRCCYQVRDGHVF